MRLMLAFFTVSIWVTPLLAETYSWTDENGTVNFTEDYSKVPKKLRRKVQKRGDLSAPTAVAAKEESGKKAADVTNAQGAAVKPGDLYDGKKAEVWQQEFKPRWAELKRLEQRLADLEALAKKPVGISNERFKALPQEFKETQRQYNDALKSYNDLNESANKAGLPAEYRK